MAFARTAMERLFAATVAANVWTTTSGQQAVVALLTNMSAKTVGQFRGGVFRFCGTGADNAQYQFKLWLRCNVQTSLDDGLAPAAYDRVLIGTGTATLSANATPLPPTALYGAGLFWADTITFTIDPAFQTLLDTLGSGGTIVEAYSPANDQTPAMLTIADFFDANAIEVEINTVLGATGANGSVRLTR